MDTSFAAISKEEFESRLDAWVQKVLSSKAVFDDPDSKGSGYIDTVKMMIDIDSLIADAFESERCIAHVD